ncbi:hypothetical protein CANCADRAFT_46027 [Tortispora caseinolytica NRRL Y-17796]|uniref:Type 1 phosphatases regulator n=1 Tax=Tortispora caseinolytica NRRL Y-17796 TaxID=767744 RepID=A0A1E4TCX1_9ASCO|nr:hypothetical protein CANCADRAFT_46027 [Tortispora caseinolytica NRRL Y-17796]
MAQNIRVRDQSGTQTQIEEPRQLHLTGEAHQQQQQQAEDTSSRRTVRWVEDTVDNEHLNKKKSKICCIYHRPKAFDESSDEDSSSSDSDSSSSDEEDCSNHNCNHRPPSPNSYEKPPKPLSSQ